MKLAITLLVATAAMGIAAATPAKAATCTTGNEHFNVLELNCTGTKFDGTGWLVRYKNEGGGTATIPKREYCHPGKGKFIKFRRPQGEINRRWPTNETSS